MALVESPLFISSVILALITLIWIYCRFRLTYWKRRGINQLGTPHWFFGHFKDAILFRTAPGWHLGVVHKKAENKPYIGFYILHKPAILLRDGWTFDAFQEMKYLDQCVAESVRLHPPVSTLDRISNEDYKIPGTNVTIEKGTAIYVSLYGLQHDPKHFESPEVFDPERFAKGKVVSDAYMPFGVGPRKCVGMKLGELHAKVIAALIISQYELHQEPDNTVDLDPRSTFTAAAQGITVEFRKYYHTSQAMKIV